MIKVFMDLEFTGLHQKTSIISIGLIAETGHTFYAELKDFHKGQADNWIHKNIIDYCIWLSGNNPPPKVPNTTGSDWEVLCDMQQLPIFIRRWFSKFDEDVEIWGDVLGYDWVLFCEIWGGALRLPENVYYIPFDIATLFKVCKLDPDINRELFVGLTNGAGGVKHNSLWDAKVIQMCYDKLIRMLPKKVE